MPTTSCVETRLRQAAAAVGLAGESREAAIDHGLNHGGIGLKVVNGVGIFDGGNARRVLVK